MKTPDDGYFLEYYAFSDPSCVYASKLFSRTCISMTFTIRKQDVLITNIQPHVLLRCFRVVLLKQQVQYIIFVCELCDIVDVKIPSLTYCITFSKTICRN